MKTTLFWLAFFLFPAFVEAQIRISENFRLGDTAQVHFVELLTGKTIRGRVEIITDSTVIVWLSPKRRWEYPANMVSSISAESPRFLQGKWKPGAEQLIFTPAASGPKRGEIQCRNTLLLRNSLDFGITHRWSAGVSLTPGWYFNEASLRAKYWLPLSPNIRVGGGAQVFGYRGFKLPDEKFHYLGTVPSWFLVLGFGDENAYANFSYNRFLDVKKERLHVIAANFFFKKGVSTGLFFEGIHSKGVSPFEGSGGWMGVSFLGKQRRWSVAAGVFNRKREGKDKLLPLPAGSFRISY